MTKEELRKSLDFVNEEREKLQRELERKDNIINQIKKYVKDNKTNTYQTLNFENGETYNTALLDILDIVEEKHDL